MWKTRAAVDYTQRGKLTVDVRIASLAQWGEIQTALSGIANITAMTVTAMDISYARIQISYGGGLDQLREQLAAQGLTLAGHGGQWTLANQDAVTQLVLPLPRRQRAGPRRFHHRARQRTRRRLHRRLSRLARAGRRAGGSARQRQVAPGAGLGGAAPARR